MTGAWTRFSRLQQSGAVGVVVVVAVVAVLVAGAVVFLRGDDEPADAAPPLDIAVIGDSFAQQSAEQIVAQAEERQLHAEVSALGGTALCSFDGQLEALVERRPEILILSFAGNNLQQCINPTCVSGGELGEGCEYQSPAEVGDLYRQDVEEVLADWEGRETDIYVMVPPPVLEGPFEEMASAMRAMYQELVADHPDVGLLDPTPRLDPEGQGFVERLPCEDWDQDCEADGTVIVRQDDGIHLTPAGGERYARALFDQLTL